MVLQLQQSAVAVDCVHALVLRPVCVRVKLDFQAVMVHRQTRLVQRVIVHEFHLFHPRVLLVVVLQPAMGMAPVRRDQVQLLLRLDNVSVTMIGRGMTAVYDVVQKEKLGGMIQLPMMLHMGGLNVQTVAFAIESLANVHVIVAIRVQPVIAPYAHM
jgi:hypothetical protein